MVVEKAITILIECGADVNMVDSEEKTPVFRAIEKSNFSILNTLLKYNVELGRVDD